MKWTMKIQKLGRIQIPSSYLKANNIKEGMEVDIEEFGDKLLIKFIEKV